MTKQGCFVVLALIFCSLLLTGCVGSVWTGATLIYDRHSIYKKWDDYELAARAGHALFDDKMFKQDGCSIDVAVFNGDVLLAGHVPTQALRQEAESRMEKLPDYRRIFNQLAINGQPGNLVQDGWITTKIRSRIFADSSINPHAFKIVTDDRIVYLMGDVKPAQAEKVIYIARNTTGVKRVVKLMKYYNLSDKPNLSAATSTVNAAS